MTLKPLAYLILVIFGIPTFASSGTIDCRWFRTNAFAYSTPQSTAALKEVPGSCRIFGHVLTDVGERVLGKVLIAGTFPVDGSWKEIPGAGKVSFCNVNPSVSEFGQPTLHCQIRVNTAGRWEAKWISELNTGQCNVACLWIGTKEEKWP